MNYIISVEDSVNFSDSVTHSAANKHNLSESSKMQRQYCLIIPKNTNKREILQLTFTYVLIHQNRRQLSKRRARPIHKSANHQYVISVFCLAESFSENNEIKVI